tara:strand:- start:560 stop:2929 length:2370 start_codon:yes stop_codon:yes gene_type:complete
MHPHDLWLVNAFPVDRTDSKHSPMAATFQLGEEEGLIAFLEAAQGGSHNVYFSVNPPVGRMTKKALRTDIEKMTFLHVDLDPRAGEDPDEERVRLLELVTTRLPAGIPKPTAVVDSGGGFWAFWRLDDPFPIESSEPRYEEAKLYNLHLETVFGADSCHNVDRIARLPGSVNYPDKKKLAKGRIERLSEVVELNPVSYKLADFTKATQLAAPTSGFSSGKTVKINENVQRVEDLNRELPPSVPGWCKVVIAQGKDPDDPTRFAKEGSAEVNRSDALFYTVCELVRNQVTDDMIYAIITDPDWAISASVIDGSNGRGDRYARRQIERAHEFAEDPQLADLNNRYAVVQNAGNGKCKVIYVDPDSGLLVYQAPTDFKAFYSNQFVEIPTAKGVHQIPLGKWWFESSMRRSFRSIAFLPGDEVGADVYNLWRGFAYEALPGGSCDLFLEHVRQVICSGDLEVYEYLISWMAMAVQHPAQPGHTAIVLRGSQGAGKGTFAKTFSKLFGHHGKQITDAKHLTGNFNAHLRDAIVLFADEAIAASNSNEGVLKALVTEESMLIEAKGIDSTIERNYLHVIMASNSKWVVPVGLDDRRFVMLDVSDEHVMDANYWGELNAQLRNGGYESLLHTLLTRDLSGFDPRTRPVTDALQDQKQRSFGPLASWWYGVLQEGAVGDTHLDEATLYPSSSLAYEFNVTQPHSDRVSVHAMRKFMQEATPFTFNMRQASQGEVDSGLVPVPQRHPHTGEVKETVRPMTFELAPLVQLRNQFDETHGGPYDWAEPGEHEAPEPEAF